MIVNPESVVFCRDYCPEHPDYFLQFVCDRDNCDNYLSFQCQECRKSKVDDHPHDCPKTSDYTQNLHAECLKKLKTGINEQIAGFSNRIRLELDSLNLAVTDWYSPMTAKTTEKQFVLTVQNPTKWSKIQETANLKDQLITVRLNQIFVSFKKELQYHMAEVDSQMQQLRREPYEEKWEFDKSQTHKLLNISGYGNKILDKKSVLQKFCVSILNKPISPFKEEISFTINSQHVRDKMLVIGLCSKKTIQKAEYQSNLRDGIYAIYQAAKECGTNNAFSLHCSDESYHYKQNVGWNFKSGDVVTVSVDFHNKKNPNEVVLHFYKKGIKDSYEMVIKKSQAFLYPFVGMYSSGDKVSIEQ